MAIEIITALSTTDRTGQAAPGGGTFDYSVTTLDAWRVAVEGRGKDVVARDNQETLWCYPDWPSGLNSHFTSSAGWVTDSTRNLRILGTVSTNGTLLGGGFLLVDPSMVGTIRAYQEYMVIEDIAIDNTRGSSSICFYSDSANYTTIKRCIFQANNTPIRCGDGMYLENSIFISKSTTSECIRMNQSIYGNDATVYSNVTAIGGNYNYFATSATHTEAVFTNLIGYDAAVATCNESVIADHGATNIFGAGFSPDDLGITLSDADFEDPTNGDYHLAAGSQAQDVGTDLSGQFTDDIDGDTRSAPWDVGADEIAGAAPPVGNAVVVGTNF